MRTVAFQSTKWAILGGILVLAVSPRVARAADATVSVGNPDVFAEPPPRSEPQPRSEP